MHGLLMICLQSLVDVARAEAERRQALDQQGIEAKVIESIQKADSGSLTISKDVPSRAPISSSPKEKASPGEKASIQRIRGELQKLDRTIRQTQERLESRKSRLLSERWAIPKTGKASGRLDTERSQTRLKQEIEELERLLEQLKQERSEVYDRGRKAGFLPGELTGRGIIP